MAEKLGFRESMTESEILAIFKKNKEEKDYWQTLDIETKRELIQLYKTNKREFHESFQSKMQEKNPSYQNETLKSNNQALNKFFATQGIYHPSQTTSDAFVKQNIMANFDKFYHALGSFTLNMEKQAMYNYYQTQQNQNFIQIAQNDTLIKQNDEIIDLLKTIANK
ncbi:hypothetical protein [Staphylococcus equorum]|uniref:hypothetical protein n=1 Tax=Staphylococcus equorum TaxID=246432 RepID=UPI00209FC1BA|nr:hypothetical protein [Staphylococcus equorum]